MHSINEVKYLPLSSAVVLISTSMPKSKSLKYDMKNEARLWSASKDWVGKDGLLNKMAANTRLYFISK
jgi:hypothetical protein